MLLYVLLKFLQSSFKHFLFLLVVIFAVNISGVFFVLFFDKIIELTQVIL